VKKRLFERTQRREEEINYALRLEEERHEAVIKNMQRLRGLRLVREEKLNIGSRECGLAFLTARLAELNKRPNRRIDDVYFIEEKTAPETCPGALSEPTRLAS